MAREQLIALYLDWKNNYCSLFTFADHHGLTLVQATELVNLARDVFESKHPDA